MLSHLLTGNHILLHKVKGIFLNWNYQPYPPFHMKIFSPCLVLVNCLFSPMFWTRNWPPTSPPLAISSGKWIHTCLHQMNHYICMDIQELHYVSCVHFSESLGNPEMSFDSVMQIRYQNRNKSGVDLWDRYLSIDSPPSYWVGALSADVLLAYLWTNYGCFLLKAV